MSLPPDFVSSRVPISAYFNVAARWAKEATEGSRSAAERHLAAMRLAALLVEQLPRHPEMRERWRERGREQAERAVRLAEDTRMEMLAERLGLAVRPVERIRREEVIVGHMVARREEPEEREEEKSTVVQQSEQMFPSGSLISFDPIVSPSPMISAVRMSPSISPHTSSSAISSLSRTQMAQVPPPLPALPPLAPVSPAPPLDSLAPLRERSRRRCTRVAGGLFELFAQSAAPKTRLNVEVCGILAGRDTAAGYLVDTVIVPQQTGTSDTCAATDEVELLDAQLKHDLICLGWIHTHPQHRCFLSSVDVHTSVSYQSLLPEALSVVIAPTDTAMPIGVFQLSSSGMQLVMNCNLRGFHQHNESSPIYFATTVRLDNSVRPTLIDLRK